MNIFITGGSRGIGAACVKKFCDEGHRVVFTYCSHEEDAVNVAAENGAQAIQCDLSNPISISEAAYQALSLLGKIDVLVNNAGISQIGLFTEQTDEQLLKMIHTNLSGVMMLTREISREMVREHFGSIIQIGSMWGKCGASCEVSYSAAKAGLRGFTMALAKELGPSGIRVNCVEPGVIQTDMNAHLSGDVLQELKDSTPLCRLGTPMDVANLVAFLSSEQASFITGQIIGVDGGYAV